MTDPPRSDASAPLTWRESLTLIGLAGGMGLLADGLLLLVAGTGSFYPATSATAGIAPILTVAGLAVVAAAWLPSPRRTFRLLGRAVPRLYPFGSLPLHAALLVLLLLGGAAVFHGVFDVLSGAHNGGQTTGIADQSDLDGLLIAGSVVVWLLTLYSVVGIYRVIQMGRRVDASGGRDVYGRTTDLPARDPTGRRRPASPPAPARILPVTYVVCLVAMLAVSAGLQILEADIGPAPTLDWLLAQAFLPLFVGPVASAVAMIDRGLRELELQYVAARGFREGPGRTPVGAEPSGGAGT